MQVGFVAGAAPQDLRPTQDGRERGAQFMRQRGQEFVLHLAVAFGFGARFALAVEQLLALFGCLLGSFVQARVVDGDRGLGCNAADNPFGALGKHGRLGMAEEQAADHRARAKRHRHGQVTAYQWRTRRQAVIGAGLLVARFRR